MVNFVITNAVALGTSVQQGVCTVDRFTVSAGGSQGTSFAPVPGILCGVNTGQQRKSVEQLFPTLFHTPLPDEANCN